MDDGQIGRVVRAVRYRKGWRQSDVASKSGHHRSALVALEAGGIGELRVATLRDVAAALGLRLVIGFDERDISLARLLDSDHAFLENAWKQRLERWGWEVRAEVGFNHFGDRGRIDLLAWHPGSRLLAAIEVKTVLASVEALLGGVDTKLRVVPRVARAHGWQPIAVLPVLVLADTTTNRRRLAEHAALFASFGVRGRAAIALLRSPVVAGRGSRRLPGLLCLTKAPPVVHGDRRRAGRQRIRVSSDRSRSQGVDPSSDSDRILA